MNYWLLTTEGLTALLATGLLILGLLTPKDKQRGLGYLTLFGLVGILGYVAVEFGVKETFLDGMYIVDPYASFFKLLFLSAAIIVVLSSIDWVETLPAFKSEFFALIVYALLGMMVMASAGDLVTLYIGLELMTITFYILAGYLKGDGKSAEAGMKYLILGAMSSAVLLYGLSLIYGLTGTTVISEIADKLTFQPLLVLGLVFLITGFAFKISAVPFHMWTPDVYEGAPTPITAFLAVASKAAGFAVMVRVFLMALPEFTENWVVIVAVMSAITMIFGNVVAIPQSNIKRLLAYSGIAQAGYILVGLVAADQLGLKGVLFYSMLYVFSNLGAFAVVTAVGKAIGSDEIKDYAGLSQRSPLMAAVMVVCLLSLAGIPPLAGFVGKFYLFEAVIKQGYLWLAFIGLLMSMVSVYYYLMVAKVMYLDQSQDMSPIQVPGTVQTVLYTTMIITLLLGVYPRPLSELANIAAKAFF